MNGSGSQGLTPSEKYLSVLCRKAFLSLWGFPNPHKTPGHELCDLLVIFGKNVLIFSVKSVKFNDSADMPVAWKRWVRKAVFNSAKQLYGAESRIRRYPEQIYLDAQCQIKIPLQLPDLKEMKIFRIVVSLGIHDACKDFFGGKSLGSLMTQSDLVGEQHYESPFTIGHVNPEKGFVHVFDDLTLDIVLNELDTISDFVEYLSKKEELLSRGSPAIWAPGEEQLLEKYLTNINAAGEHDFNLPLENCDILTLSEGSWEEYVKSPEYRAKKEANRVSYVWDGLIEHFINHGSEYSPERGTFSSLSQREQALRIMASETRVERRHLSEALYGVLIKDEGFTRLVVPINTPDVVYLFLSLPKPPSRTYEDYREKRQTALLAYCKVAKLKAPWAKFIVGLATETKGEQGWSEDLLVLDVGNWTKEDQSEAERLQKELSLLLEENISRQEFSVKEYPDVPNHIEPQKSVRQLNRKQRRILEAKRRRRKK